MALAILVHKCRDGSCGSLFYCCSIERERERERERGLLEELEVGLKRRMMKEKRSNRGWGRGGNGNECGCGCMWALVHLPLFFFLLQPCGASLGNKGRIRGYGEGERGFDSPFCCYLSPQFANYLLPTTTTHGLSL